MLPRAMLLLALVDEDGRTCVKGIKSINHDFNRALPYKILALPNG
jgi:hypothetical protein